MAPRIHDGVLSFTVEMGRRWTDATGACGHGSPVVDAGTVEPRTMVMIAMTALLATP